MPPVKHSPLMFGNLDLAEPVDPPPVLFHAIRTPCACGRSLTDPLYTFFPSAVFVHGQCEKCGAQSAIFAPHMKGAMEPMPAYLARTLQHLVQDVGRAYGEHPSTVLAQFLDFLVKAEAMERPSNVIEIAEVERIA